MTTLNAFTLFFGYLALRLEPVIALPEHDVDTAAVAPDGTLFVNHHFLKTLSDPEVAGLLAHEVLHVALLCWARQGTRKALVETPDGQVISLWNLAHDVSFNPDVDKMAQDCKARGKIALPKFAAVDMDVYGKSAEEIYDIYLDRAKKNKKKGGGSGGSGGFGTDGKFGKLPGNGKYSGDDLRSDLAKTRTGKLAAQGDKGAQQKLENEWKVATVAAAQVHERNRGQGSLPLGIKKFVDELQEAKVPWLDVLSQWLGENGRRGDYSYRRPSRRSESAGAYLPSAQRHGVDDVTVVWDTSGSMNGRETGILSEVQGICEDVGISLRVICIDTQIHSDVQGIDEALKVIPHIKGGGGSNFNPAFAKLEKEGYDGVVVAFTDGYITVPAVKPPLIKDVLWCLTKHDKDPSEGRWGQVLHIEDD
jgi:predicted metal-dependent peptidase